MPVHSKPVVGRTKHAPPLLGPKPYQKAAQNAWVTPSSPVSVAFTNGPTDNESASHAPSVQFSVLRRPAEKKTDKVTKSPQVVRFGAAEVVGGEKDETVGSRGADSDKEDVNEEYSSASSKQTAKLSQISSNLSGAQALKECEEHTDWANEVLTRNHLPLISDLRKSIGDGFTLPTILEIISGVSLSCVKTNPASKEERVLNLLHCLKFLCKRGVNVSGIQPAEIEDGHLKPVLLLIGNIRQHFKNTYRPEQNGYAHPIPDSSEISSKPSPVTQSNMPGAMKLPGAVPTPFVTQGPRNNIPEPASKPSGYPNDEILPGVLGRDVNSNDTSKPHFNIISTTEIGTNGVAQHGVDERKHHLANSTSSTGGRGMVIRHPNARTSIPNMHDQSGIPPSVTQRAWTGSPRPQNSNVNGSSLSPSVEDRLKNLLGGSRSSSRDNLGYFGGGFHGGSSEILDDDDGEFLIVPQPVSRNSPDFEVAMLGDRGYGPGYRPLSGQHTRQRSQQGYVPSKPSERVQGSRAEVIISRPPSAIAFRKSAPSRGTPQNLPGSAPSNSHDSGPYNASIPSPSSYGNRGGNPQIPENANKHPGPVKGGSNDLRNAWNKLYGPQAQVPPYGGPGMKRGDQFRSSYGHQSPQRVSNNIGQHSVTFAQPPAQMSSRPVSAPAPAQMQAYFQAQEQHLEGQGQSQSQEHLDNQGQGHPYTSHQRESPMGQSSSTQGHLDESSSSQQSRLSQDPVPKHLQVQTSTVTDNNYGKLSHSSHSSLSQPSPNSPTSPNYAIGPASKYPDNPGSRPSSARKPSGHAMPASPSQRLNRPRMPLPHQANENIRSDIKNSHHQRNNFSSDLTTALQAASKDHKISGGYSFDDSRDRSHDQSHDMSLDFQNRSIFDYNPPSHSESTGSVTPPLPPLSPTNTPPDSPQLELGLNLHRSISATNMSSANPVLDAADGPMTRKPRRTSEVNFRTERQTRNKKGKNRGYKTKGANLNDVRESGSDTESNLSFDIDDTILTVESHDTEQQHPAGDILSSQEVTTLRDQLHNLESKYHNLQNKVVNERPLGHRLHTHNTAGKGQGLGPPPIGRQRRWSIGSSDTSSFRREARYKPGKQIHHKHHSKEFKNINKRFQRLESHVVTLARSVAHLSSELRTHNTMVNDLETVKRELRELRDNPTRPFPNMIDRTMAEQERFRDWVPSLTNPKRVNKLTKFFGSEPPLLELFLEKLGYKKYISNFQSEHIGMIELPYMTEDRLEKIGVPMGPRIRILQEAQSCFRHENMNIYLV